MTEAIKRQLERSKVGLIVAECGSGKTKIGTVAITAAAAGLLAHQRAAGDHKTFNLVLCPSHVTEKWDTGSGGDRAKHLCRSGA